MIKFFLLTIIISIFLITSVGFSYADVISPKKQASLNFLPEDIVCKEDLVKLYKINTGKAACVEPSSATKLVEFGWASPLSEDMKSDIITKKATPAGTVKTVNVLKQVGAAGKLDTTPRINAFNYVFEACAGEKNIRAPEVVVTSDSETKSIKLASQLKAEQCRTTSTIIKANDPQSISSVLLNKGGITKKINDMESNLTMLLSQLEQEKKLLTSSSGDAKKTSEITQKIVNLKKEINSQRYDIQKYQLFLFADPKKPSKLPTLTSFTGKPVEGLSAEIISLARHVSQPKESQQIISYNVIFGACAGPELVRIPMVVISSDEEIIPAKIADKIPSNTCQQSVAKILAKDKNSIEIAIDSKQSISSKINEIETNITELVEQLNLANKNLTNLLTADLTDPKINEEITMTTTKISDLRSKITAKKAEVASLLLQTYR